MPAFIEAWLRHAYAVYCLACCGSEVWKTRVSKLAGPFPKAACGGSSSTLRFRIALDEYYTLASGFAAIRHLGKMLWGKHCRRAWAGEGAVWALPAPSPLLSHAHAHHCRSLRHSHPCCVCGT
jgi:hypothetical protein